MSALLQRNTKPVSNAVAGKPVAGANDDRLVAVISAAIHRIVRVNSNAVINSAFSTLRFMVMSDNKKPLGITDVVLRDAHNMATRLRLDDMLPIAEKLDQVGFGLESGVGAFDACIRYLGEDPGIFAN